MPVYIDRKKEHVYLMGRYSEYSEKHIRGHSDSVMKMIEKKVTKSLNKM